MSEFFSYYYVAIWRLISGGGVNILILWNLKYENMWAVFYPWISHMTVIALSTELHGQYICRGVSQNYTVNAFCKASMPWFYLPYHNIIMIIFDIQNIDKFKKRVIGRILRGP